MTLISFSKSHRHFDTQILIEKSLCAHYLLNQWLEFYQISTDTSLGQEKEVIRFWWPWSHFQGHYITKILKMSLMCTLSHESIDGIWDRGMKWLDFGDLDLIFKLHRHFETQILIGKSLCAHYLLNQWLEFYQTSTDTSLGQGKEEIRFWWPWPHFQGNYIIKWALCAMSRGYLISTAYNLFSFI